MFAWRIARLVEVVCSRECSWARGESWLRWSLSIAVSAKPIDCPISTQSDSSSPSFRPTCLSSHLLLFLAELEELCYVHVVASTYYYFFLSLFLVVRQLHLSLYLLLSLKVRFIPRRLLSRIRLAPTRLLSRISMLMTWLLVKIVTWLLIRIALFTAWILIVIALA